MSARTADSLKREIQMGQTISTVYELPSLYANALDIRGDWNRIKEAEAWGDQMRNDIRALEKLEPGSVAWEQKYWDLKVKYSETQTKQVLKNILGFAPNLVKSILPSGAADLLAEVEDILFWPLEALGASGAKRLIQDFAVEKVASSILESEALTDFANKNISFDITNGFSVYDNRDVRDAAIQAAIQKEAALAAIQREREYKGGIARTFGLTFEEFTSLDTQSQFDLFSQYGRNTNYGDTKTYTSEQGSLVVNGNAVATDWSRWK